MAPKKDERIDQYIRDAAPFARPILKHLRKLIHQACPAVEETFKWSCPHFSYQGKLLCGTPAFKAHCLLGFRNGSRIIQAKGEKEMEKLYRITRLEELPSDRVIVSFIKLAMTYNEPGAPKSAPKVKKPEAKLPADFARALKAHRKAFAQFEEFSPSKKREYIEWIASAKAEETRERRLETAIAWISQGKSRNWKYQK